MKGLLMMGMALALFAISALTAHAELTAHAVIIDSTLKLSDGTTNNGVRAITATIPRSQIEAYQLIRIHNRLPPYTVRGGKRLQLDYQRWNNRRLDIYAKNMTASRLRQALRENGLEPREPITAGGGAGTSSPASNRTAMPSYPGRA